MDNDKKPSHLIQPNQYGFALQTHQFSLFNQHDSPQPQVVSLVDIRNATTSLSPLNQTTQWRYQGKLLSPQNNKLRFIIDQHNCDLIVDIQGEKLNLSQKDNFDNITINNVKKNQPISVTITAVTHGHIPSFRLLWDVNGKTSHVPNHAMVPFIPPTPTLPNSILLPNTKLQIGSYRDRGRIAIIDADSTLLAALKTSPEESQASQSPYKLFSWLIGKPRTISDMKQHFILSTLPESDFSGFEFHPKQGLFIDSFNSYHEWRDGEPRAQNQIADLLLPSGQWYRHYDVVVLGENANDKQVKIVRHWLELTGGSLLIIKNNNNNASEPIKQLIRELQPIQQIETPSFQLHEHSIQHVISLPTHTINSLMLTEQLREKTQYFSIIIKDLNHKPVLTLHDVPLESASSWQDIAHAIKTKLNQSIKNQYESLINVTFENHTLKLQAKGLIFSQFQLKQSKLLAQENQKADAHQILPILITENPDAIPHQLSIGAITGRLPNTAQIKRYDILEQPKFGFVYLDQKKREWQYHANQNKLNTCSDQFDLVAIMGDEQQSAPISIQLQTGDSPQTVLPSKRTFSIADPIYHEPAKRHHPIPDDMQVQQIQLAQTHLQPINDKHMSLTANRWVMLKLDVTSQKTAKSPNFEAIVSNKDRKILGRIRLTGPETLPTTQAELPHIPNILAHDWHQQSFTAPLKGEWLQPGIQLIILANNKPIITEHSDKYGFFSPNVTLDSHITVHIANASLYRQGHGIYADSPFGWGLEAAAILPTKQLTLYSSPAIARTPSLIPYKQSVSGGAPLIHPKYDDPEKINSHPNSQINWAYLNSQQYNDANSLNASYHYTAIHPFTPSIQHSILGLASPFFGGGTNAPTTLFHEIFGHGLGQPHTTVKNTQKSQIYPFDAKTNGTNPAYNQYRQHYSTYRYIKNNMPTEMYPTMFPYKAFFTSNLYDVFLPHSDYYNMKIHEFFRQNLRWQPNKMKGQDTEDGGFAGEGFYQRWDEYTRTWVTLNENNFLKYYSEGQINLLPHQRDVPIYWIYGHYVTIKDGAPHPYNSLTIDRTIGNLPADYHNLITGTGRNFHPHLDYAIKVTYATPNGLLTETLQIAAYPDAISVNIADKGELVKFSVYRLRRDKKLDNVIYQYTNPDSIANRLFANSVDDLLPNQLIFDNYWHGGKIFWTATDSSIIDFATATINTDKITAQSAISASWVENGKLHKRYFSLSDPFGTTNQLETSQHFEPLNHLGMQVSSELPNFHIAIPSEQLLIADMNIHQQIDISELELPAGQYTYWVTLVGYDDIGAPQEIEPLETWYFSTKGNQLTVQGTINSTPELELAGIQIHIDQHLGDNVAPSSIWLYQNKVGQLAENTEFLNYDRPVEFNSIINRPELLSSMPETETYSHWPTSYPQISPIEYISSPLMV